MRWIATALTLAACGGSQSPACVAGAPPTIYAIQAITLPQSSADFAVDLNGDGHTDDRLGNVTGALLENMIDPQAPLGIAIEEQRLQFQAALAPVVIGSSSPMTFSIGEVGQVTQSACVTTNGDHLESNPTTTPLPVEATLHIPFVRFMVPITIVRTSLKIDGNTLEGVVNGAIRSADVSRYFIPGFASYLQTGIGVSGVIESLFDTGGEDDNSGCVIKTQCSDGQPAGTPACRNPQFGSRAGECADQCDLIIDTCEVSTNSLIKNLLAPDVQLFAADGSWAPSADNKKKDSLSFGFGFTAVAGGQ